MQTIKSMYWRLMGREADQGGIDHYVQEVARNGWEFVYNDIKNSTEGQYDWDRRNPTRVGQLEDQAGQLILVKQQLEELKNRPPEVVVKEVEKIIEKIVEKPVEVVKEVEKPATWQSVVDFFRDQLNRFLKR